MKIIELRSKNVKRLSAVEIKPDGSLVIIGGDNAQGKSSVLDSIIYVLGGKKLTCDNPIRDGQTKADGWLDLGDFEVKRSWSSRGRMKLEIKDKKGKDIEGGQGFLDAQVGDLTFDPLKFLGQRPDKQLALLRKVTGVDTEKLDTQREEAFAKRTDINRDLKGAKARLGEMPNPKNAGKAVDEAELREKWKTALAKENEHIELCNNVATAKNELKDLRRKLKEWEDVLESREKSLADFKQGASPKQAEEALEKSSEHNELIRQAVAYKKVCDEVDSLENESYKLTDEIEEVDEEKEQMLSDAHFPVKGLSFGGDSLVYNGQPFEQASHAEKLKVAVGMGLALNSNLRLIIIKDGSLLDHKSLATIAGMAEEKDAQIWIERVGKGDECGWIIEDGSVLEVRETATA